MQQPKIVVIGGSLVGPAGALFLRQHGYTDVTVLEANRKPYNQSGGIMGIRQDTLALLGEIGLTPHMLTALTDPDVYAYDVHGASEPTKRGVSTFPGHVSSWDALHFELGRRVDVQLGHAVKAMHAHGGRQYLECSCGNVHEADIVLWADGRKSTGRTLIEPHRTLTYNGYVVWRGLVAEVPQPTPKGFNRYYDIPGGRLFSVTEPIIQSGRSYFEFSHNLPASEWETLTGKRPERHAYMLPHQVTATTRLLIADHAIGLPHRFEEIIEGAEISGIPVNDTPMPGHSIHHHRDGGMSVLFGDALVPVRLQVGAGFNQGVSQIYGFAAAYKAGTLPEWERRSLAHLGRWVEQGRSRAHRNNLGWYLPVQPGRTTAPGGDQWDEPRWVSA